MNESLTKELVAQWLSSALDVLSNKDIPDHEHVEIEFDETGWTAKYPAYPDYRAALVQHSNELAAVSGVVEIVAALESMLDKPEEFFVDGFVNPLPTEQRVDWLYNRILLALLNSYLESNQAMSMVESEFIRLFDHLMQLAISPAATIVEWETFICNVDCRVGEIRLEPNVVFRRLSLEEQQDYAARQVATGGDGWGRPQLVLEVRRQLDGRYQGYSEETYDQQLKIEEAAVLALRLVRSGRVRKLGTKLDSPNPFARQIRNYGVVRDTFRLSRGAMYNLSGNVAKKIVALWPHARRAVMATELEVPLTRFDDVYDRRKEADRLVDCWVALESLYLIAENRTGMGELTAIAASNYLGKNSNDRHGIYTNVMRSFRLRSLIVHGDRHVDQPDFSSIVTNTEDILRKTLAKRIAE